MPYSIEYDSVGIIRIKVQGALSLAGIRDVAPGLAQLIKEKHCPRLLTDLREARLKLSMPDIYTLPKLVSEIASARDLPIHTLKRAIVVSQDTKLAYFFETVSRNRVQNVQLFYDDTSAQQWLLIP